MAINEKHINKMKAIIRVEELFLFIGSYIITLWFGYSWWLFWALLLAPDISMLGYLVNTRIGAYMYNLAHHKGIAIIIAFCGFLLNMQPMLFTGILMFGHSSMDRVFGYGLKFPDHFKNTHLGKLK